MPINRKDFDKGNFEMKNTDRWNHPIALLLRKNTGLAFRVDEIEKNVTLSTEGIRGMLHAFVQEGWIVHKQPYWAWKKGAKQK